MRAVRLRHRPVGLGRAYHPGVTCYVGLLRAVNVGGGNKLPMAELRDMCEELGFEAVRTYIASGNVVFRSELDEAGVQAALSERLRRYAGRPIGVVVRTAAELEAVAAANPFPDRRADRTVAIFMERPPATDALERVTGRADEELVLGLREIYVHYGEGMGRSKLRIADARDGTARNMNTVVKLAEMARS